VRHRRRPLRPGPATDQHPADWGRRLRFALVERFCRVLSSMAGAGVSLPEALRVATESMRNLVFMRNLNKVGEAMLRGEGLAQPLGATGLFPATGPRG